MMELNGLNIEISKGDTGSIRVTFTGQDVPEDGTIALVSVKSCANEEEPIWEKRIPVANAGCVIQLLHEDTSLPFGIYKWDLRLIYNDGGIYTPMKPAKFIVVERVGNAEVVMENG